MTEAASDEFLQAALALHAKVGVFDAHCDTLGQIVDAGLDFVGGADPSLAEAPLGSPDRLKYGQIDLPRMRAAGVRTQVLACWNEPEHSGHAAFARCLAKMGAFHATARRHGLKLLTTPEDLMAPGEGFILSLEDAEPIMASRWHLEAMHALGLRMVGLTWNGRNALADGVGVGANHGGLTDQGALFVGLMQDMGIAIDLAHVAERSFWDAIKLAERPVMVSHANAKALCEHRRNLTDAQLEAVAASGGVVGLTFVPYFLRAGLAEGERATIEHAVAHIEYMWDLIGPEHVGLGADYDGISVPPEGLEDVAGLPRLTAALLGRGHDEAKLTWFLGRAWREALAKAWRP